MGIQINGNTDTITAIDGALTVSGAELAGTSNINVAGIITATGFVGNITGNVNSSGVSTFAAGSASAPSITPTGDSNTGIFFPLSDTIAFAEGGVEGFRLDSSGNIGINSTIPAAKMDVVGGGDKQLQITGVEADIWLKSTGPGTTWRILGSTGTNTHRFRIYDQTNNVERFGIDSSGRVTKPYQPVFKAYRSASTSGAGVIAFNNVIYNVGSSYNNSNGLFTAPVAGYYTFFFLSIGSGVSNTFRDVWGSVNGTTTPSSFGARPTNQTTDFSSSGSASNIVYLNANDTFGLYASGSLYSDSNIWLQFGGYLLG